MGWGVHDYPTHPDWNEPERAFPKCPNCRKEAETFYRLNGEIIGCEYCVESVDAWDMEDEE